ncbi:MAG: tetratricopeptide repeat protein, partial [Gemmatimonadaceae bacterium]|nr:tetratricopeptide repeat protein [Gemmatimonadaceae bacterium]
TLYAEALMRCGEPQRASAFLKSAVPALALSPHRTAHRTALDLLGAANFALGALDDAQDAWDRALELAQQAGDTLLVARATNNLGAIACLRGAWHDALSLYQLAVPVYQRLGDMHRLAETFHNLAIVYRDLGDLAPADEHEMRAIQFARQAGAERLVEMARVGRAELALRRGDYPLAAAGALAAGQASAALGDRETQADAWRCSGEANTALGRNEEARTFLDGAIELADGAGQALMHAEALLASARLSMRVGDRARAGDEAGRAAESFRRLGARDGLARYDALVEELFAQ